MIDIRWLMVKYPAGAGGMIILHCLSTSKNVANWHDKTDPIVFVDKNFALQKGILPVESHRPYNLTWFTKQLPFERGLNLTKDKAYQEAIKEENICDCIKKNLHIPFRYTRIDNPLWFVGKIFSISIDETTKNWLLKRRKMLFFKIENDLIIDLRFHASNPNRKFHSQLDYKDDPPISLEGKKLDDVVYEDFYKNYCDRPHIGDQNITVSDILNVDHHQLIFDKMENLLQSQLDRNWCVPALKRWAEIWRDL